MSETQTFRKIALSKWRHAVSIEGDGRYAVLAPCRDALTVTLWPTVDAARERLEWLNSIRCGGGCWPSKHRLVDLAS